MDTRPTHRYEAIGNHGNLGKSHAIANTPENNKTKRDLSAIIGHYIVERGETKERNHQRIELPQKYNANMGQTL